MLLEDEHGTINLIVPPPVHERCRAGGAGRAAGGRRGPPRAPRGRRQRAGADASSASSAPTCRPPRCATSSRGVAWSTDTGEDGRRCRPERRSRPPAHSFGRRGAVASSTSDGRRDPSRNLELGGPRLRRGLVSGRDAGPRPACLGTPSASRRSSSTPASTRSPSRRPSRRWARVTPDGFTFDVKLHRLLSRHAAPLDSLPPDLRDGVEVTNARGGSCSSPGSRPRWRTGS